MLVFAFEKKPACYSEGKAFETNEMSDTLGFSGIKKTPNEAFASADCWT